MTTTVSEPEALNPAPSDLPPDFPPGSSESAGTTTQARPQACASQCRTPLFSDAVASDEPRRLPTVEVVVPVFNEARTVESSVRRLVDYVSEHLPFATTVTVADNASDDATPEIVERIALDLDTVNYVRIETKGRGNALRSVWSASDADIVAYTDADLSTGLEALLPLVAPLVSGHSDLAIGCRLAHSARVVRGTRREFISRCYNRLLQAALGARFRDAQCGFKAIRRDAAARLLPHVRDDEWFFDTELLLLAERNGMRIHEVPVDWVDDPNSSVDVLRTSLADLRGIVSVRRRITAGDFTIDPHDAAPETLPLPGGMPRRPVGSVSSDCPSSYPSAGDTRGAAASGAGAPAGSGPVSPRQARPKTGIGHQLVRFVCVGVLCTLGYLSLFALLDAVVPVFAANAIALGALTIVNTTLNRSWTFGAGGRERLMRDHAEAAAVFLLFFVLTSAALAASAALWPDAPLRIELGVLLVANAIATLCRFVLLRSWVFDPKRRIPALDRP